MNLFEKLKGDNAKLPPKHSIRASWWSVSIAVGTSIAMMMLTRTTHPPAGSNPVIIYLLKPAWSFLLFPTLFGAIILVFIAVIYNNLANDGKYPKYW